MTGHNLRQRRKAEPLITDDVQVTPSAEFTGGEGRCRSQEVGKVL